MQWTRDFKPDQDRDHAIKIALIITLTGNIILAVGKGLASYFSGSIALYADSANSVSDVIYSIALVLGLWLSTRPPDLSHPQGHERFEPLVGLIVAITMGIAGYEALRSSFSRFLVGGFSNRIELANHYSHSECAD